MAQVINTNISSLTAQRNLTRSQDALGTSLQRLSSGLRINSAKDDAAGLAISERFTTQIRGMNQAIRNANDGISLAQTAEGAMGELTNNLQRVRELAVQSANATNSSSDRVALQNEVTQLVEEIDRVAQQTKFNGVTLLDGTFSNQSFQIGADAGQTITMNSISNVRANALGASYAASVTSGAVTGTALSSGDLIINGVTIGASSSDGVSSSAANASAKAKAAAINAASGTNVTATANATSVTGVAATAFTAITAGDLTVNGVSVGAIGIDGDATARATSIINAINGVSGATGVTASNATATTVTLTAADGRNITIGQAGTASAGETGLTSATTTGTISLSSTSTTGITIAGATPANAGLSAGTTAASQTGTAVSNLDISTIAGANAALSSIDSALATVNTARAQLGAFQNRFSSVVASLQTNTENLSASRSRIQDADFASETASLTRGQILQQAGIAILAQANAAPQSVLSLLR
jgi:flagellin